jgi:ATP-binding cassette subfamily B protein
MTIGTFILVNTYMFRLVQPLETIGYAMQQISQGFAFLHQLLGIFREPAEDSQETTSKLLDDSGEVHFKDVCARYEGRVVLERVSFSVPAGRTLAIVGTSGAGKSTIVRLLVRLIEPESGKIFVDGLQSTHYPLSALRHAIAVVPQDTVLFNESIGYNIGFGRQDASQAEIERAAKLAHLHDFVISLPEGYDTKVGERGVKLSGGEKQRVSIARAAIKRPHIYIFDEATSSLDSRTEREILQNIRELSRNCTAIIIAHRLSTVVHADEIIVLEKGEIVERGTHSALLKQNGRYFGLWEAQQSVSQETPVALSA